MDSIAEIDKFAYRTLLYYATLDIRNLCQSRGNKSMNPLEWKRQYDRSRIAGGLADCLHNLAAFAANDFIGFKQDQFWKEYQYFWNRFGAPGFLMDYRKIFDDCKNGKGWLLRKSS